MTKVQAVRREFNEPFREVVKGLAGMGYSQKAAASLCGMNREYFRATCKRFGVLDEFKPVGQQNPAFRGGWDKQTTESQLLLGYYVEILKERMDNGKSGNCKKRPAVRAPDGCRANWRTG